VSRDVARRLFAERAEAEQRQRQREARQRHEEELAVLAAKNRPAVGIPIPEGLEDVDAVTVLMQHEIEAKAERKGARQRSTLDEMFTGVTEYHPISDRESRGRRRGLGPVDGPVRDRNRSGPHRRASQ
jgi:hypothetical protein